MPVDHSVSALANLIHHDLHSLAKHTHTLSYREYTHNRTEHTTLFSLNIIHTIHHRPSDVIRNSARLTYSQPRPFLPSFPSLPPSNRLTILFSSSLQHKTTPHPSETQTGPARRRSTENPPFFEFPRENPRNAGAPCFSLTYIRFDRSGFGSDRSMRWNTWLGSYMSLLAFFWTHSLE